MAKDTTLSTSIVFGARGDKLDKDLTTIQRKLKRFGRDTERLGQNLSRSLTLPLAAFGAGAVKAFSDIETIEVSFRSLTGSAEEAKKTVADLANFTKSTPFRLEGVSAAARQLLAVGISADQLPTTLKQIGDAAAVGGKPIEDLARVFAKTFAKGKAQTEELFQVIEAGVPITRILGEQFGITEGEVLKMAERGEITREVFTGVFQQMNQEGGPAFQAMANLSETLGGKFSTLADEVQFAAAEIGKAIVETTDFSGILTQLTEDAKATAERFGNLSEGTQKFLVEAGLTAAALGPVLTGIGKFAKGIGGLINGFKKLRLAKFAGSVVGAIAALNPVTVILGGIALALGRIVFKLQEASEAFGKEEQKLKDAAEAHRSYQKALKQSIEQQRKQAETLTLDEQLEQLTPGNVEAALGRIEGAASNIELGLDIKIPQSSLDRIKEIEESLKGKELFGTSPLAAAVAQFRGELQKTGKAAEDTGEEVENLTSTFQGFIEGGLAFNIDFSPERILRLQAEAADEAAASMLRLQNALDKLGIRLQRTFGGQETGITDLLNGLDAFETGTKRVGASVQQNTELISAQGLATQTATGLLQVGFDAAAGSSEDFGQAVAGVMRQVIASALSTAMANAIAAAFSKDAPTNIFSAGLAAPAVALASLAFIGTQFAKIPKFATGGIVTGPVTGLIGEAGPEAILPLDRLHDFITPQVQTVQVVGNIQGGNIFLSNERAAMARNRIRV